MHQTLTNTPLASPTNNNAIESSVLYTLNPKNIFKADSSFLIYDFDTLASKITTRTRSCLYAIVVELKYMYIQVSMGHPVILATAYYYFGAQTLREMQIRVSLTRTHTGRLFFLNTSNLTGSRSETYQTPSRCLTSNILRFGDSTFDRLSNSRPKSEYMNQI